MFSKTVVVPRRVHRRSQTPEHPHLAVGITRPPRAILHIHPHMSQGHLAPSGAGQGDPKREVFPAGPWERLDLSLIGFEEQVFVSAIPGG